jgi:hypothetical protein
VTRSARIHAPPRLNRCGGAPYGRGATRQTHRSQKPDSEGSNPSARTRTTPTTRLRSSAEEHRASTPCAEVRILSEASRNSWARSRRSASAAATGVVAPVKWSGVIVGATPTGSARKHDDTVAERRGARLQSALRRFESARCLRSSRQETEGRASGPRSFPAETCSSLRHINARPICPRADAHYRLRWSGRTPLVPPPRSGAAGGCGHTSRRLRPPGPRLRSRERPRTKGCARRG